MRTLVVSILLFILTTSVASTPSHSNTKMVTPIQVDLFISSTCPYCHQAEIFLHNLQSDMPWLHVNTYVINEDKVALEKFHEKLKINNQSDFSVPSLFFCGARWVGFDTPENIGKKWVAALGYCHEHISETGMIEPSAQKMLQNRASAMLMEAHIGMKKYSNTQKLFIFALIDAINVCALFCIVGFLAILFRENRFQARLQVGVSYILAVGCTHFLQQAYSNTYYHMLTWLRIPAICVGIAMLVYLIRIAPGITCASGAKLDTILTRSDLMQETEVISGAILRALKAPKFFIILIFFFASLILAYQQSCSANLTAVFDIWLNAENISTIDRVIYLFAYQMIYLLPLSLLLICYLCVGKMEFMVANQARLRRTGCYVLCALALCLIIYPFVLSNANISLLTLPLMLWGWYFGEKQRGS